MNNIKNAKLAFGVWKVKNDSELMYELIKTAYKSKYDYIDTAAIYQNEEAVGEAITKLKSEIRNFDFPIQTKIWTDDFKKVKSAFNQSLKRLQIKKVDSILLHRPHWDMNVNIKAWKDLIDLKQKGLVSCIGVSNFDNEMIDILYNATHVYPEVNQIEFSVAYARYDRIAYCMQNNIKIQAYRTLTEDLQKWFANPVVKKIAKTKKCHPEHVLISYAISQNLTAIVKSINPNRIVNNKLATKIKLSTKEIELLKSINSNRTNLSSTFDY